MRLPLLLLAASFAARAGDLETEVVAAELARHYDEPLLRRAAASEEASVRRAAARAGGRMRDRRALAWLLPLLRDPVGPVRRAALFSLGLLGGDETVIALRDALPRAEPADRPFLLEALGRGADPRALPILTERLLSDAEEERTAAALALFRLRDPSALPEVFGALLHERASSGARWALLYTFWRLASAPRAPDAQPEWTAPLLAATKPERPFEERVFATLALGALRQAQAELRALLRDGDPRVAFAAARALTKCWSPALAESLVAAASPSDPLLLEEIVSAVQAGGKEAEPFLRRLETLAPIPPRNRLQIGIALATAAAEPAWLASASEEERALPEFEELQWRAGLARARLPDALPKTTAGLAAAAEVLGEETAPAERARELLSKLVLTEDFVVRSTAISSIGKRGLAELADAVVRAAESSPGTANADVRIEAASALAKLKLNHAWLARAAVEDPDRVVRDAARAALVAAGAAPPPEPPAQGYRLGGLDAAGILAEARRLAGARVILETDRGTIEIVLYPDEAPAHCVSIAGLVRRGFYDGLTWHRVVADFVIQGGCPRGDGAGGPGYFLPDEIGTRPYVRGTVGMPKAGDDTGGCQIFITHLPTPHLDGRYTVFGQVVSGLAVVDRIRVGDRIRRATLQAD